MSELLGIGLRKKRAIVLPARHPSQQHPKRPRTKKDRKTPDTQEAMLIFGARSNISVFQEYPL